MNSSIFMHQITRMSLGAIEKQNTTDSYTRILTVETNDGRFELHFFADSLDELLVLEHIAR